MSTQLRKELRETFKGTQESSAFLTDLAVINASLSQEAHDEMTDLEKILGVEKTQDWVRRVIDSARNNS